MTAIGNRNASLPPGRGRASGFTLIELMVTLTVLAVMLGIGVPSFRNFIAGQKVKTATYDVMASLLLARSEAVKRNTNVALTPGSATAWADGWTVSTGTLTLLQQQAAQGVTITPKDPGSPSNSVSLASLSFAGTGRPAAKAYFEVTGVAGAYEVTATKCVKLDPSGIPSSIQGVCR